MLFRMFATKSVEKAWRPMHPVSVVLLVLSTGEADRGERDTPGRSGAALS